MKCLLWDGAVGSSGYGRLPGKGLAHRRAWEEAYGPIPEGMNVLHKCDTKLCIEPTHLYLGTQKENVKDGWDRGQRTSRYTRELLDRLWEEYLKGATLAALCQKYNVTNLSRQFQRKGYRD